MSEAPLEIVAEAIPHIVWLSDVSGAIDYCNDRSTDYLGLPRQALYGWQWVDVLHPDDADRVTTGWAHATSTATPYELCNRIRRTDGTYRWHTCRALPVRDREGEIIRWLGTADDLTELPTARDDEAMVERQITEFRAMLEVVQDPRAVLATTTDDVLPRESEPQSDKLTARDLAVARLVGEGHTNAEIASLLGFSIRTIEANRAHLREVLGLKSRAELVRFARESDL